jgi:hypothetical protein
MAQRQSFSAPHPDLPFVLRLGITGHRDPGRPTWSEHVTRSSIRLVLGLLDAIKPGPGSSGATPKRLRIISSLAEGADRIAVDATFGATSGFRSNGDAPDDLGWTGELCAVLPYGVDAYREHDCEDRQSSAEFDRLLGLDRRPIVLHDRRPVDETQRDRWYRDAGHYVADHCDVLIALWDGTDNGKPAGTAATVEYALGHGTPVLWIPTERASGGPWSRRRGAGRSRRS